MSIMETIVREAHARGYSVELKPSARHTQTVLHIAGENIEFFLLEPVRQEENPKARETRSTPSYYVERYLHIPSGILSLEIEAYEPQLARARRRWKDTTRHRVEDCIQPFFNAANAFSLARKERRAAAERQREEREVAEVTRIARLQAEENERRRIGQLVSQAEAWKRSRLIREYVQAKLESVAGQGGDIRGSDSVAAWATWARAAADNMDPLHPDSSGT